MSITQTHTFTVEQGWKTGSATVEIELRSKTHWGAAITPTGGRTLAQEVELHEKVLGRMRCHRTFDGGKDGIRTGLLPASWFTRSGSGSTAPGQVPGWETRESLHSLKADVRKLAAGDLDDETRAYLRSIPRTGFARYLALWHEAEAKIRAGLFTIAEWVAAQLRFARLVAEVGHPDVRFIPIFTSAWALQPSLPYGIPAILDRCPAALIELWDGVGFDPYNDASTRGRWSPDLWVPHYLDPIVGFCFGVLHGKPILIGETGCLPNPDDVTARPRWFTDLADYAEAHRFPVVCLFDAQAGTQGYDWHVRDGDEETIHAIREVYAR